MVFHPWFAPRTYEIGWVIHPDFQQRGYASEAASTLLRYGFEVLELHHIIAAGQPENSVLKAVDLEKKFQQYTELAEQVPAPIGRLWQEGETILNMNAASVSTKVEQQAFAFWEELINRETDHERNNETDRNDVN